MVTPPIRALIVDDDAPARQRLRTLSQAVGDVVIAGECADGRAAVEALAASEVDLVLLDVVMPRLDGFAVVAEVGPDRMPPVVFTSAHSEFAVRAFEAYALDYLLKPFDDARFLAALGRVRPQVESRRKVPAVAPDAPDLDPRLYGLLEHLRRAQPAAYPDAIAIRTGSQYLVIRAADIDWIEADGNYSKVFVNQRPRLLTKTLAVLEKEVLDPATFVRVHRSAIVNTRKIAAVEPLPHGELVLVLHDNTRVQCSRRHRKALEEKLYFTT